MSKNLSKQPLYLGFKNGIELIDFNNPVIDEKSKELVKKGNAEQRYAFVGWYKNRQWHLRMRPSFQPDDDEKKISEAEELFGKIYLVFSDLRLGAGFVHRVLEKQITLSEPDLVRADAQNPKILQFAGSFWKLSGDKFLWINRSSANININIINELALACFAFDTDKFDFLRETGATGYTLEHKLERSLAGKAFIPMAQNATETLEGKETMFRKDASHYYDNISRPWYFDYCLSFDIEQKWQEICEMKEGPEKLKIIHDKLMRTIYIASGIIPDSDGDGFKPMVMRTLKIAKEEGITLNLNYIPDGFNTDNGPALAMAIKRRYFDVAELLLDNGAQVDLAILQLAIKSRNIKFIKVIMAQKNISDILKNLDDFLKQIPKIKELTEFVIGLIESNLLDIFDDLLKNVLPITVKNNLLFYALNNSNKLLIEKLLFCNADANAKNCDGISPLYFEICNNHNLKIIELLLENKANPDLPIDGLDSPFLQAILRRDGELISLFSKFGNPLLIPVGASRKLDLLGREPLLKLLIENPEKHRDDKGDAFVHLAVKDNNVEIIQSFLDYGFIDSIFSVRNAAQQTAWDIIINNKRLELVQIILPKLSNEFLKNCLQRTSRTSNEEIHKLIHDQITLNQVDRNRFHFLPHLEENHSSLLPIPSNFVFL